MSATAARELRRLGSVETLNLGGVSQSWSRDLFAGIGEMPGLRALEVHNSPTRQDGIGALHGVRQLESLKLLSGRVDNDQLSELRGLTSLRSLEVVGSWADDAGTEPSRPLSGLRTLFYHNGGVGIGDVGLARLCGLGKLQSLSAHASLVSNVGMAELPRLTNLRHLTLVFNQNNGVNE